MASVHSSRAKVYERRTPAADEPTEHLESEGERLIKEMALKQTETQINLAEQLQQEKHFEKATEFVPVTKYISGENSLKEFQSTAEMASFIENLKSFGLTSEEIDMIFAYKKGQSFFFSKYRKMEKSVLLQRVQEIFAKIEAGRKKLEEPERKQRGPNMSRHEQELGVSVKPGSEETKLFMFATSNQQQESPTDLRPPEHPINQLKELEQQMFGHLTKKKRAEYKYRVRMPHTEPEWSTVPACSTTTAQNYTASVHSVEGFEQELEQQMFGHLTKKRRPEYRYTVRMPHTEPEWSPVPACSTTTSQNYTASVHNVEGSDSNLEQQMFGYFTKESWPDYSYAVRMPHTEPEWSTVSACSTTTAQNYTDSVHNVEGSDKNLGYFTKEGWSEYMNTVRMSHTEPEWSTVPAYSTTTAQNYTASVHNVEGSEKKSLWDCKEPITVPSCSLRTNTRVRNPQKYTFQPNVMYTVWRGQIMRMADIPRDAECEEETYSGESFVVSDTTALAQYNILSPEDIMRNKLSVTEIKKIPKFENYKPGIPSEILFVKNLAKEVTELDLISVFSHLEDPGSNQITYRLMAGKMKGQAFIKFPSIEKATLAMETVNGFLLYQKPMVIQYGLESRKSHHCVSN